MNIIFPAIDEAYIKAKVEDGFYSNATELVRDAVRRFRENDDNKYMRLMEALEIGERDIKEGRSELYTPKLLSQIALDAEKYASAGKKPSSDVS